jgi:hypothetical protein
MFQPFSGGLGCQEPTEYFLKKILAGIMVLGSVFG